MTYRTRARIGLSALGLLGWIGFAAMAWASVQPYRPLYPSAVSTRPEPLPYALSLTYAGYVIYYCDETGVPVWLACRMFSVESSRTGNPTDGNWVANARNVNTDGSVDQGIGQLNSLSLATLSRLYNKGAAVDPLDPAACIRVALRYLSALHAELNDWRAAVGAYNCGLSAWRTGRVPDRTRAHIRAIMGEGK